MPQFQRIDTGRSRLRAAVVALGWVACAGALLLLALAPVDSPVGAVAAAAFACVLGALLLLVALPTLLLA